MELQTVKYEVLVLGEFMLLCAGDAGRLLSEVAGGERANLVLRDHELMRRAA